MGQSQSDEYQPMRSPASCYVFTVFSSNVMLVVTQYSNMSVPQTFHRVRKSGKLGSSSISLSHFLCK